VGHTRVHEEPNNRAKYLQWYLGVQITANSKFQHNEMRGDFAKDKKLSEDPRQKPVLRLPNEYLQTPLK
jgi:hypothetical protein